MCEIQKFETTHDWNYDGCAKCASKLKGDIADFICPICKKKPELIEPKSVIFTHVPNSFNLFFSPLNLVTDFTLLYGKVKITLLCD